MENQNQRKPKTSYVSYHVGGLVDIYICIYTIKYNFKIFKWTCPEINSISLLSKKF